MKRFIALTLLTLFTMSATACLKSVPEANTETSYVSRPSSDMAMISRIFPSLEGAIETKWEETSLGDKISIAGPTDYKYQGYIVLDEESANKYFSSYAWEGSDPYIIFDNIDMPNGEWRYSHDFCKDIIPGYYNGSVWLSGDTIIFSIYTT